MRGSRNRGRIIPLRLRTLTRKKVLFAMGIVVILLACFTVVASSFFQSLFVHARERVNIVMYGEQTSIYSIELGGALNYVLHLHPDTRVTVPGGYETYRSSAVGRLTEIENSPDLIQKTYSLAIGSMINLYYYPTASEDMEMGSGQNEKRLPSAIQILFSQSNASFFDRLYTLMLFADKHIQSFEEIHPKEEHTEGKRFFSEETFEKKYLGYFYKKRMREENKTVQIRYKTSYRAAQSVAHIADGEGIRVVDIDRVITTSPDWEKEACLVTEDAQKVSLSATNLIEFFGCSYRRGKTGLSDIVLELYREERVWR